MQVAKDLYKYIISKLDSTYDKQEASSIAFILLQSLGVFKHEIVLNNEVNVDEDILRSRLAKLIRNVPIQYILNEAHFYGREFYVDENVLIPRSETELLCQLILDENKEKAPLKILDIGTGSGCIPITLKLENPDWEVHALDVSEKALNVAQRNAKSLNAEINFIREDILESSALPEKYDVIVSNPPYVTMAEMEMMNKNVTENEPHLALFVENHDPLRFYKKIISLCVTNEVNKLYFEVNESFGEETKALMVTNGFLNVCIHQDFQNKNRMVSGEFCV